MFSTFSSGSPFTKLILKCRNKDPSRRPSFKEIREELKEIEKNPNSGIFVENVVDVYSTQQVAVKSLEECCEEVFAKNDPSVRKKKLAGK